MSRLLYAPAAKADLDDIWSYTVERWGEAQAADYLRAIDAACRGLVDGAKLSKAIDDIRPGYRKAFAQRHVIYFRLDGAGDAVIVRILHQVRDVERHLPMEE